MVGGAAIVVYPVLIACGIAPQIAAVCNLTALTPATMLAALSDRSQLPPFNRAFAGLIVASVVVSPPALFSVMIRNVSSSKRGFASPRSTRTA